MTFTQSVATCLRNYVTFSGRAARPEYWWFFLFVLIANIVAGVIDWQFFTDVTHIETAETQVTTGVSAQPVQGIVGLLLFLPHLAAAWRRMHDTGRSGWYVLLPTLLGLTALGVLVLGIGTASLLGGTLDRVLTGATLLILIPTLLILLISPLLVLWWLSRPSQPGANVYGPNPHDEVAK